MAIHRLSARKVATARAGKYEDGDGLRLVVAKTGSRRWVLRFTLRGKRREMGLGGYPEISLDGARKEAAHYRRLAREGRNPVVARKQERQTIPTFTACAARYIHAHRHGWSNPRHARQWVRTLKTYARPVIGTKAVDEISTEDVLAILTPIWTTKTETAKRVHGRIE